MLRIQTPNCTWTFTITVSMIGVSLIIAHADREGPLTNVKNREM